ncbi:MAG TPA: hypothetical protein EYM84_02300 [Flavobacteriales bacterium]|nr:hypothetical protein [Flavobacteriales bacterium]
MSIIDLVSKLKFTQGIYHANIFGELTIYDAAGFEEKMGLHGEETLYVKFNVPLMQGYTVSFEASIIGIIGKVQLRDNFYAYSLSFVSKEAVTNFKTRIQKTYRAKTHSFIAREVFNNYLKCGEQGRPKNIFKEAPSPKELVVLDETVGITNRSFNNVTPMGAIDILASNAKSEKSSAGASYLFFETLDSFVFGSLEHLISQDSMATFRYTGLGESVQALDIAERNLEETYHKFLSLSSFNSPKLNAGVLNGVYSSKSISYDPVRRRSSVNKFNYFNTFNNYPHLNSGKLADDVTMGDNYNSHIDMYPTQYGRWEFSDEDKFGPQNALYRNSQLLQLYHGIKFNAELYGYPSLRPGNVIYVAVPNIGPAQALGVDTLYSGKYIITAIEHVLVQDKTQERPKPKMVTNLVLASDTFGYRP